MAVAITHGDVILTGSESNGYTVLDAASKRPLITQPVMTLQEALAVAREHGARGIWQQTLDKRGRPLGPPSRITL